MATTLHFVQNVLYLAIQHEEITQRATIQPVPRASIEEAHDPIADAGVQWASAKGHCEPGLVKPTICPVARVRSQPFPVGGAFLEMGSEFIILEFRETSSKIDTQSQAALRCSC